MIENKSLTDEQKQTIKKTLCLQWELFVSPSPENKEKVSEAFQKLNDDEITILAEFFLLNGQSIVHSTHQNVTVPKIN